MISPSPATPTNQLDSRPSDLTTHLLVLQTMNFLSCILPLVSLLAVTSITSPTALEPRTPRAGNLNVDVDLWNDDACGANGVTLPPTGRYFLFHLPLQGFNPHLKREKMTPKSYRLQRLAHRRGWLLTMCGRQLRRQSLAYESSCAQL